MVENYVFLFLGDDDTGKKIRIDSLKAQYLDKDLKDIDFEIVYSDYKELNPKRFDEILSYFPTNPAKKRIIFVKKIEALNKDNRNILLKYLKSPLKSIVLLLDSDKLEIDDPFIGELKPFVKIFNFRKQRKVDVFDLTRAIVAHNDVSALRILNLLLKNQEKPQNILGAIFWQWQNSKNNLSLDKFREGLRLLLDTDIKIKTGRLQEELALQLVVIRLTDLS